LACISPLPLGELNPFSVEQHIFDTPTTPTIAAAASLPAPEVMSIELSGDPLGPCTDESISIGGHHVLAGLHVTYDDARVRLQLYLLKKVLLLHAFLVGAHAYITPTFSVSTTSILLLPPI
jgi:hypothetical protein